MFNSRTLLIVLGVCMSAGVAQPCAIDMPNQLLANREKTLNKPLANSFAYEIMSIAGPVTDDLKPEEDYRSWYSPAEARATLEHQKAVYEAIGLSIEDNKRLVQVASSGDEATILSARDLPIDVRLYAAGAENFRRGQWSGAAQRFEAVLALPPEERKLRATFAAYSLGRSESLIGDDDKAIRAFQQTRELATAGVPDPSGLAVASFGEEAGIHLRRAEKLAINAPLPVASAVSYGAEMSAATLLYAQQAARGSESGLSSLRIVAQNMLRDQSTILAAAEYPASQRLMTAFLLARFWQTIPDPNAPASSRSDKHSEGGVSLSAGWANDLITTLADASKTHAPVWLVGGDRLAALAYREGKYDVATTLLERASGPLASWLKAKLALQRGDLSAAAQYYAEAARAFPTNDTENSLDQDNRTLLPGETGVLALARGEYLTAFEFLYRSNEYWSDAAYVAERVLTVDELKAFADSNVPPPKMGGSLAVSNLPLPTEDSSAESNSIRLRHLLARRLMRQERYQEALPYFDDRHLRQVAMNYARAIHEAKTRWTSAGRAEAWYRAAALAQHDGMEIMGSEGEPDYGFWHGEFEGAVGPENGNLDGRFVTIGEQNRVASSKIEPDKRFHYRYVAVNEAVLAVNLLPSRSQAFAAVLCHATAWMQSSGDDAAAQELYRRYVREGAFVPWAKHFARECPQPDFDEATRAQMRYAIFSVHRVISRQRWLILFGAIAIVAVLGGMTAVRRRRKPENP